MRLQKYIRSFGWPEDTDRVEYGVATRADAAAMNELFNRVFRQQRPVEHYLWKAWESPAGPPVTAYARDKESGRLVCAITGIRRWSWLDGRPVLCIQTCETCTDPDARGGGRIYQDTVKGGMARAFDEQRIYWGYGGQSNLAARTVGARWFGYQNVFTLEPLELRLSLVPALRKRLGGLGALLGRLLEPLARLGWRRRDHGYRLAEARAFGPEFDRMWEKHRDRFRLVVFRDAAALDWRYARNPAWQHRTLVAWRGDEPCGYVIWREWAPDGVPVATVLDLWDGNDADLAEALLDGLRRRAARAGSAFVQFHVLPGRPQEAAMRRFRSCRVSPHLEKDHVVLGPTQGADEGMYPQEAIDMLDVMMDPDAWYYTQGDSDLRD